MRLADGKRVDVVQIEPGARHGAADVVVVGRGLRQHFHDFLIENHGRDGGDHEKERRHEDQAGGCPLLFGGTQRPSRCGGSRRGGRRGSRDARRSYRRRLFIFCDDLFQTGQVAETGFGSEVGRLHQRKRRGGVFGLTVDNLGR